MKSTTQASLQCLAVTSGYGEREVLHGIDLSLEPGTVTALLGPNGSGKSTLLKTIARSIKLRSGEIKINNQAISSLSSTDLAKLIAYVPQEEPNTFAFLVRDVVTLGRLPHSGGLFDTAEDRLAATEAMEIAHCLEFADRPVTELSGGEKQRVLIARAIAQDCPIILLDEPTSHLDIAHQVLVVNLMKQLKAQGKAILAAIHDLNIASAMADQAVVISEGSIRMNGPVAEVLQNKELDHVYGVEFLRTNQAGQALQLFPSIPK